MTRGAYHRRAQSGHRRIDRNVWVIFRPVIRGADQTRRQFGAFFRMLFNDANKFGDFGAAQNNQSGVQSLRHDKPVVLLRHSIIGHIQIMSLGENGLGVRSGDEAYKSGRSPQKSRSFQQAAVMAAFFEAAKVVRPLIVDDTTKKQPRGELADERWGGEGAVIGWRYSQRAIA